MTRPGSKRPQRHLAVSSGQQFVLLLAVASHTNTTEASRREIQVGCHVSTLQYVCQAGCHDWLQLAVAFQKEYMARRAYLYMRVTRDFLLKKNPSFPATPTAGNETKTKSKQSTSVPNHCLKIVRQGWVLHAYNATLLCGMRVVQLHPCKNELACYSDFPLHSLSSSV